MPTLSTDRNGSFSGTGGEERTRLQALRRYNILDTAREEAFDRLTVLAAEVFGVDVAFISFLDADRQWVKASVGLDREEIPLDQCFCTHTIESEGPLVVEDARDDDRGRDSPLVTEDGLRFYAGVPLRTPDGHAIGTFCIMDSDPQQLSEEAGRRLETFAELAVDELRLRRQERLHERAKRRFEAVLQDPNVLAGVLAPDGTLLEANATSLEYVNDDPEEILGTPFWETPWWPDHMRANVRDWVERAAGGTYVEYEADLVGADGEPYSVEGTVRPVFEGETVVSMIVSARDVTQRKQSERELRLFQQAVEQAEDSILITEAAPLDDPGPRIEYVNPAFEEMTGYEAEEICGRTPRILQGAETDRAVLDSLRDALEAGEGWEGETVNSRKDGTPYRLRWSIAPVRAEDGDIEHWVAIQRDVTEEREREQRLRRQRNLLEQAQRLTGAWEVDLRTGRMSWSEKVYEIHEVDPGTDLDVEKGLQFYAPEARPRIREAFERCVEEGKPYDLELPVDTAKGNRRWVRTVGAPAEEEDGEVIKVAGAFQDITERKVQEEKVRQSRNLLRIAGEMTDTGGWVTDLREGPPYQAEWTEKLYEIFDLSGEETPPTEEVFAYYHPDDRDRHREAVARAAETGEGWDQELRLTGTDGGTCWVRNIGRPVVEEGEIVEIQGAIQNITEQKEMEQELRETRDFYEQVFDQIPIDLAVFDREGRFVKVNAGSISDPERRKQILGKTNEEYFRERGFDPEVGRRRDEAIQKVLETGEPDQIEETLQTDEGPVHYLRVQGPVTGPDGEVTHVAGYGVDLTERKRYEERLRKAKTTAEEAAQLKTVMLANMSHEVRTPLTSMIGFSGILKNRLEGRSAKLARLIYKSGERLEHIIEAILKLSELEAGGHTIERETVQLSSVAERLIEEFRPQAGENGVDVDLEAPDAPVEVHADEIAVRRVIGNLLDNAIKFTPEGGQVTVRVYTEEATVALEVEDTGVGIAEEALPEVFETFKQESEGLSREYQGTGLGLSIVQKLVDALGGTIDVETEKGEGTKVTVHLPRVQVRSSDSGDAA